jgi:hypothetical protein
MIFSYYRKGEKIIQKIQLEARLGGKPDWPDWLKGQITVPIDRILSVKNAQAWVSMDFT